MQWFSGQARQLAEQTGITRQGWEAAVETIRKLQRQGQLLETPLLRSETLARACGAKEVWLKAENLQKTGAYKVRGATVKIARLSPEKRAAGVVAASAGNHAQGVALAATRQGIRSVIVMPTNAPEAKKKATESYQRGVQGSKVVQFGDTFEEARDRAHELEREQRLTFIEPFDDLDVISGQGTLAYEIYQANDKVDVILVGIGGGGLIAGISRVMKELKPSVRVIGVEAAGAASMRYALDQGHVAQLPHKPSTIADGIKTDIVGARPFTIVERLVAHEDVVVVDDTPIKRAMALLLQRCKLQVEGAGACTVAALLHSPDSDIDACEELVRGEEVDEVAKQLRTMLVDVRGKNVVAVLSGGNVDVGKLAEYIQEITGKPS